MTKSLLTHCATVALAVMLVIAGADIALAKKGGHGHGKGKAHGLSHKANWKSGYAWQAPPGWSKGNKRGWGCVPGTVGCVPPGQRF